MDPGAVLNNYAGERARGRQEAPQKRLHLSFKGAPEAPSEVAKRRPRSASRGRQEAPQKLSLWSPRGAPEASPEVAKRRPRSAPLPLVGQRRIFHTPCSQLTQQIAAVAPAHMTKPPLIGGLGGRQQHQNAFGLGGRGGKKTRKQVCVKAMIMHTHQAMATP